jgi:hypothetical protein
MKVLFIVGKGRSGSTLVDLLLGRLDGWFGMGEFDRVWVAVRDGFPCGCGNPVLACPIWGEVLRAVLAHRHGCDPDDDEAIRAAAAATHLTACRVLSYRELPYLWLGAAAPRRTDLDEHVELLTDLYRRLAARTNARVMVNSSKWPGDPGLMDMIPGVEPYAVHLVRDPRGVAHSWSQHKAPATEQSGRPLRQNHVATSAAGWIAKNVASEVSLRHLPADRHLLLRYEDLTASPAESLRRLTGLVDEPSPRADFVEHCAKTSATNHTVGGNPDRLEQRGLRITHDDRWRTEMSERAQVGTALLSAPLMRRYGYSVRSRRS